MDSPTYMSRLDLTDENLNSLSRESSDFRSTDNDTSRPAKPELWNVFRRNEFLQEDPCCQGLAKKILKAAKVCTYIVLFLCVFCGVIATRGSLQILTTQFYNEIRQEEVTKTRTVTQDAISWMLIMIISLPDLFKILQCLIQFLFGDRGMPDCLKFIWNQVKESLHVVGLCGLVFRVMPYLGPVEVSALLAVIPGIPSLVQTAGILLHRIRARKCRSLFVILSAVIGVVLIACLIAICVLNSGKAKNSGEFIAWVIVSGVTLSLRWVENYIATDKERESSLNRNVLLSDSKGAPINHLVSSILRVIIAAILYSQYFCKGIKEPNATFNAFIDSPAFISSSNCSVNVNGTDCYEYVVWQPWDILPSFFVHLFTALVVYHCAVVACRLCMQKACFVFPLAAASPVYAIIVMALSDGGVSWVKTMFHGTRPDPEYSVIISLVIFIIAWIFQLFVGRQIWREPKERLSFTKRLFSLPHYCSPVLDLSLIHSRKRFRGLEDMTTSRKEAGISMVYIAATMWHENRVEMKQILQSLFRLDMDQFARKKANEERKIENANDPDYYEFEGHIPFDDAMTTKDNERVPNDFVKQLLEVIEDAGRAVHQRDINLGPPRKLITPYGGRFVWTLPGSNKLIVHLKDKDKMRHKKRWSQIMYMYFGIGYELMEKNSESLKDLESRDFSGTETVFENLPDNILKKAENTYFLALDGDVDFEPDALRLLIDSMKQNPKIGATCGRIKPLGSGPVVWYQRFEYAIGHWLQKSAEHVFGCVLCSPGCFSLFRAKALMDDNVMRTYAILPHEPRHYLQYDQGEDRWLCTLLLQQGYRIEYCAAAEAWTYAPEDFKEFFNQRRRWLPSTMANILDLLQSYHRTTSRNTSISYLYIFYTLVLFISSVLGPSTVLLALESSIHTVFEIDLWLSYLLIYGPTVIFIFICLKFKAQTQLNAAVVLSALYAMAMMAVLVGIIVSIAGDGWYAPTAVFFYILVASFIIAGFLHIHEIGDLLFGFIYFICIPAGYLFLIIYAICNLNNVSWGTREQQKAVLENTGDRKKQSKKKQTEEEFSLAAQDVLQKITEQVKAEKIGIGSCGDAFLSIFRWANNLVILNSLATMQKIFQNDPNEVKDSTAAQGADTHVRSKSIYHKKKAKLPSQLDGKLDQSSWAKTEKGKIKTISEKEAGFWRNLIETHLYPLEHNEKDKQNVADALKEFRNKVAFAFFFVNALWVIIMTAMNQVRSTVNIRVIINGNSFIDIEPLGFVFLVIFAVLLIMQMFGMVVHRYGTLLHVISATELRDKEDIEKLREQIKTLASHGDEEYEDYELEGANDANDLQGNDDDTDIDEIYENFQDLKKSAAARRPAPLRKKLDLEKNFRATVKNIKRRQTQNKKKRIDWKGRQNEGYV